MSIRLRLVLWCGGLCALVLAFVSLLSYTIHVRGHYDDTDRTLVVSAEHLAAEAATQPLDQAQIERSGSLDVVLRLYDSAGQLQAGSAAAATLPPIDPRAVLAQPSGPAFDSLAGLVAPLVSLPSAATGGAFGIVAAQTERVRVFVLPVQQPGNNGYVVALTTLGRLDESIQRFRLLLLGLGIMGVVAALVAIGAVAGRVLRPIDWMTQTARRIAASRDFLHRIEEPPHHDELGRLAVTFNEMLASLDDAYRAQQRFIADASHELRAPLTAIQGNLELIRRHPTMTPEDREEALAEADREASRLGRLVADLLALARADAGIAIKRQPVDLDAVALDAFSTARQLARGHTLTIEPFDPVRVTGDTDRLKQLTLILLDNALKYTPATGSVTLGLQPIDNSAELIVTDTGVGIPAADLPHVFERFYRADPARSRDPGGTGLGLPIAKWIVEQHGGTIAIASTAGVGTTVTVRLPALI